MEKRRAEVMSMSIFEYNQEEHFRQIAKENQAEGAEKATLVYLRNLMETLQLTVDQAFDALKIPEEERKKYSKMLK